METSSRPIDHSPSSPRRILLPVTTVTFLGFHPSELRAKWPSHAGEPKTRALMTAGVLHRELQHSPRDGYAAERNRVNLSEPSRACTCNRSREFSLRVADAA